MSNLSAALRGLRLLSWAAALMLLRYLLEPVVAVMALNDDSFEDLATTLIWTGRLRLLDLAVLLLLGAGVLANLGELRRRRLPVTTAVVALLGLAIALAIELWVYELIRGLAAGFSGADELGARLEDLNQVPLRLFIATVGYVVSLFATVLTIRAFAIAGDHLPLREQARAIGGMLVLLLLADSGYRFSYGLGAGIAPFGVVSLAGAIALAVFWFWCHRQLGRLWESAAYHLRATADLPVAQVVERPRPSPAPAVITSAAAPAPVAPPPPPSPPPVLTAAVAPDAPEATPLDARPRFLR